MQCAAGFQADNINCAIDHSAGRFAHYDLCAMFGLTCIHAVLIMFMGAGIHRHQELLQRHHAQQPGPDQDAEGGRDGDEEEGQPE